MIYSLHPHAHFRGKSASFVANYPDGREETLLNVPVYDFNWQSTYELVEPMTVPAGTRIVYTQVFDNSSQNKANPDPNREVTWGEQTWDEMVFGVIRYRNVVRRRPRRRSRPVPRKRSCSRRSDSGSAERYAARTMTSSRATRAEYAILGAGAIGSILGAHLARAGHSVVMLVRERRARQIDELGLRIRGLTTSPCPLPTLRDPRSSTARRSSSSR